MTKLKTLDELEENSSLNMLQQQDQTSQIEQVFNIKEEDRTSNKKSNQLDPNMILSPRSTYSNSSVLSNNLHGKTSKKMSLNSKPKRKTASESRASVISERSVSSMSNKSNIDDVTILNYNDESNTETQSIISNLQKGSSVKLSAASNSGVMKTSQEPISYDILSPIQCADLTKIEYINSNEKYLITRLYSNVSKLSSILNELNSINLKYYLNTPDENECLPLYYAIKAECLNSVKLLIDMGASLSKTTEAGDPAPHLACLLGVSIDLIDFLLSCTGNTQKILYINDQEGWTILHCAANQGHLDIVKFLLEEKHMNPNVKDSKNRFTCLQLAAINNRIDVVEYFLSFNTLNSVTNKHIMRKNSVKPDDENNVLNENIDINQENSFLNVNNKTNNNNNNNISPCIENNSEKNSNKPPASLTGQSVYSEEKKHQHYSDEKKNSISSSSKPPSLKLEPVEKTNHSNSIDSEKSLLNLSYRSNQSSFNYNKLITDPNHHQHRLSIVSQMTSGSLIKKPPPSKLSKYSDKKKHSNSISQISTISEYSEGSGDYLETDRTKSSAKKSSRPIISLESMTVYLAANKYLTEPVSVYNNFLINLDSLTSEGQNVLHLACRYGKLDVVKILLKKYGSNELNINTIDFKGRTCLDLAWEWCINIFGTKNETKFDTVNQISLFYDQESSIYVQRCFLIDDNKDFEEQIKLINLLNSYGAKFSNYKLLMYDINLLKKVENELVNLPSNLFHPDDHISFENIRLNLNIVVPIKHYLKCILYLLKLKFTNMFLQKNNNNNHNTVTQPHKNSLLLNRSQNFANVINRPTIKRTFTSISNRNDSSSTSSSSLDSDIQKLNDFSSLFDSSFDQKSFIQELKLDFADNLNELIQFIKKYVIDSFESNIYYENIQEAFELLANIN